MLLLSSQIRIRHCPDHAAALQSSSNLRAMSSGRRRTRVAALQQDGLALALDNLTQVTTTAAAASEKPQDRMEMLNEALKTKLVRTEAETMSQDYLTRPMHTFNDEERPRPFRVIEARSLDGLIMEIRWP